MTKVCEGMLIDVKDIDGGYEVFMDNISDYLFDCTLNFTSSQNLSLETIGSKVKVPEPSVAKFQSEPQTKVSYVKLMIKDKSVGSSKFHYKFKGGKNLAFKKAKDAADEKEKDKALDDAKKAADADAAAKKKAKEDAPKTKKKPADDAKKPADDPSLSNLSDAEKAAKQKKEDDLAAVREKIAEAKKAVKDIEKAAPPKYKSSGLCLQCEKEITDKSFLSLGDKKMHKTCLKEYEWAMKNKCEHCLGVLPKRFCELAAKGVGWGVKLHDECLEPYKIATRPNCAECGNQILDLKRLERDGQHYHTFCWVE